MVQAMDPHAADCQTAMYCNRYPSVEGKQFPEGALRIGAHTDFELLTLLFTRPGNAFHALSHGAPRFTLHAIHCSSWVVMDCCVDLESMQCQLA